MSLMLLRILILETDPLWQNGFSAGLRAVGHSVLTCADHMRAAEFMSREPFDLVLIGPGQLGYDVRHLIAEDTKSFPPIVALTTLADFVIGSFVPDSPPFADLPGILEALTRYLRCAPFRSAQLPATSAQLLEQWAEYDRPLRTGVGSPWAEPASDRQ